MKLLVKDWIPASFDKLRIIAGMTIKLITADQDDNIFSYKLLDYPLDFHIIYL